jgi:serine phosphatase RsbU (regulator of sigma subunit)
MLPFNTFSIHDLVGMMASAPLAIIFYLIYARLGRRKLDLLFGNLVACCSAFCGFTFLVDNVVPAGTPSAHVADGAQRTLFLMRLSYVLALVIAATLLHFVLRYCGKDRIGRLRVGWVYPIALFIMPAVWMPGFVAARTEPLAPTSSWLYVVPYMVKTGAVGVVFSLCFAAALLYSAGLLWRYHRQTRGPLGGDLTRTKTIFLAVTIPLICGVHDLIAGSWGLEASVATVPLGVTVMGVLIAKALLQGRVQAERQREQLSRELTLASEIQQNLLPKQAPIMEGFDIAGWSRPAGQTGGDNYDFMLLPDGRLMMTLGDAAGHGMGPALVIAETRAVLRAIALSRSDPAGILRDAGELLIMDLPEGRWVTCFVGILDADRSNLVYASAGQGPILLYHSLADQFAEDGVATGPPISPCLPPNGGPRLANLRLACGDVLVLASDGFYEAPNLAGDRFGAARLRSALREAGHLPACEMIAAVARQVAIFVGQAEQEDDMTMVILRRTQPVASPIRVEATMGAGATSAP